MKSEQRRMNNVFFRRAAPKILSPPPRLSKFLGRMAHNSTSILVLSTEISKNLVLAIDFAALPRYNNKKREGAVAMSFRERLRQQREAKGPDPGGAGGAAGRQQIGRGQL